MWRKVFIFLCIVLVGLLGATNGFSTTYLEDFNDGDLDPMWEVNGNYTISDGYLHMYKTPEMEHDSSWLRGGNSGELINYLSADIMYTEGVSQIAGLALQWWQQPGHPQVTGMQLHLKLNTYSNKFFASLDSTVAGVRTNLGYIVFDSIPPNAGWNSLSIAFNDNSVTVGINGTYMKVFEGLYHNPSGSLCYSDALVHGHDGLPIMDYYVDSIRAEGQTTNTPPVADAGPNQSIRVIGTIVQLDGTQSYDPDGDSIYPMWRFVSVPSGSSATLSNSNSLTPTFAADVHGTYRLRLNVSDQVAVGTSDDVIISFENVKPVANAGNSSSSEILQPVTLDGRASTDANGDPLTYQWTLVSTPQGSTADIVNPELMVATFVPDKDGTYVVQLVVNDGFETSEPSTILIEAMTYPSMVVQYVRQVQTAVLTVPLDDFKNHNMQNTLLNKLNAVITTIQAGFYVDALIQLEDDILCKTDGCAIAGAPDSNDWVKTCLSQNQLYPAIIQSIDLLDNLTP